MIVTGLFLWWPRGVNRLGGVVYPRFQRGSRVFWRDIHSVTGLWISGLALCLLLTGLPWAKFWGDYFKNVRRLTGTAVARQDWTNGATPAESAGRGASGASGEHQEHSGRGSGSRGGGSWSRGGGGGNRTRSPRLPANLAALDRVVATVKPLGLLPPVTIAPPGGGRSSQGSSLEWTAKSTTANRPYRVDWLDGATGTIKSRKGFSDRHIIDRVVGTGIALHEGRLFGWPNQLLGLLTAVGLVLLSMSSVILWWRRREAGVLGAPKVLIDPRFSIGLVTLVVLLGIYLPLFGASLVGVLLLEWLLLRRIPKVRDWLGLRRPRADVVALEAARSISMTRSQLAGFAAAFAALGLVYTTAWLRFDGDLPEQSVIITSTQKHTATAAMLATTTAMAKQTAPTFEAEATDGVFYKLSELVKDAPVVLIFIKDGCPCSEAAELYYNRLQEAYGTRVRFLGVINGDVDLGRKWAKTSGFLPDPQRPGTEDRACLSSGELRLFRADRQGGYDRHILAGLFGRHAQGGE